MAETEKPFEQIIIFCYYCGCTMGEAYPTEINKKSRFRCDDCRTKGITKVIRSKRGAKLRKASKLINNR